MNQINLHRESRLCPTKEGLSKNKRGFHGLVIISPLDRGLVLT